MELLTCARKACAHKCFAFDKRRGVHADGGGVRGRCAREVVPLHQLQRVGTAADAQSLVPLGTRLGRDWLASLSLFYADSYPYS